MIAKTEVERFSLTSSRQFDEVLAAIKGAVGNPDMVDFAKTTSAARTFVELEGAVRKGLGKTGLMRFMELDHGPLFAKRRAAMRRAWSASSSAIRSSCRKWQSAFQTPARTLPSPYSSTNALTECTSRTTEWLVSWFLTEIRKP